MSDANPPQPASREALIQSAFAEALAAPAVERAAGVRRWSDDPSVHDEVLGLIAAHDDAGGFLRRPAVTLGDPDDDLVGRRVGRYAVIARLGEGGFGLVYRATQDAPMRRDVALKVIRPGMDTRRVIARFDAERQALAILNHPGIARVFDAGTTDRGRPYFAMELVDGQPITEWCDSRRLPTRHRLELVVPVCRALQHAHQKGIIHRDLKPNNVMVAIGDGGRPVPKIIDFGIAKATQAKLTEHTFITEARQVLGTPAYMSPEQAGAGQGDVDTRSDLYAVGVLLYELLTGSTPIEERSLRAAAHDQMHRMIRDVEPPAPSTRVAMLGDNASSVAASRGVGQLDLRRAIRGEVDWIVMRCLEKEPARRYQSAEALADDLERHLRGDEVLARPPTRAYRTRKFARRHRLALGLGSVVAASLVSALVVSLVALTRERYARAIAEAANAEAAGAIKSSIGWYGGHRSTKLLRSNYERLRATYGDDDVMTIEAANLLCRSLEQDKLFEEDERILAANVPRARRVCGPHSRQYLNAVEFMITCLNSQLRYEDALPFCKEMFEIVDSGEVDAPQAQYYGLWWGDMLNQLQRHAEARGPLLGALRILRTRTPEAHGTIKDVLLKLAETDRALGDAQQAERWQAEAYVEARAGAAVARPAAAASMP